MNSSKFLRELHAALKVSGVVVIKTPLPDSDRAIQLLEDVTMIGEGVDKKHIGLAYWSMSSGGVKYYNPDKQNINPKYKDTPEIIYKDPSGANSPSKTINEFKRKDVNRSTEVGTAHSAPNDFDGINYMVMNWLHVIIDTQPPLIQLLNDCINDLTDGGDNNPSGKRIIITVPPEWVLPDGISHVPVVRLSGLDTGEIIEIIEDAFENSISSSLKPDYTDDEIRIIANNSKGLTEPDLITSLLTTVFINKPKLETGEFTYKDFSNAMADFKTEKVNDQSLLSMMSSIPMTQVGGLEKLKEILAEYSHSMTEEGRRRGVSPKGMLLTGGAGGGKSLVAKALSGVLGIPAIKFDLSAAKGKYVGETGKNVKQALDFINTIKPCIVFVDEVDKVVSLSGGETSGGGSADLLNNLLIEMDKDEGVFYVFAANRTWSLPSELLRSGRLSDKIFIDSPNPDERKQILEIHLRKSDTPIPDDLQPVIDATNNYTAAELEEVVVRAVRRTLTNNGEVTSKLMVEMAGNINPLHITHADDYNRMREWGRNNATPASKPYVEAPLTLVKTDEPSVHRRRTKRTIM